MQARYTFWGGMTGWLLFSCWLFTNCVGSGSSKHQMPTNQQAINGAPIKIEASAPNSPSASVLNFLLWYHANREKFYAVATKLVLNNPPIGDDTTKIYRVNFETTKAYTNLLEQSGWVSAEYIRYFDVYFKDADQNFLKEPQYDGPPAYFDHDLIMLSQDYPTQEAELKAGVVTEEQITGNQAMVTLFFEEYGMKLAYRLTQENGKWLLAAVQNVSGE